MVEKKLEKYYWIGGVITLTLIVVILAIIFIVSPSFKSIGKTNKELKEKQTELKVAEQKLEKLKELKVREAELKEQSQIVYRAIPTKKEVGDIFIQLNGLTVETGGTTSGDKSGSSSSASPGTTTQTTTMPGVSTLVYENEVTFPKYSNFKALLGNTEKALRYVHLNSFKISDKDGFKVSLKYTAYYRVQENNSQTEGVSQ